MTKEVRLVDPSLTQNNDRPNTNLVVGDMDIDLNLDQDQVIGVGTGTERDTVGDMKATRADQRTESTITLEDILAEEVLKTLTEKHSNYHQKKEEL